MFNIHVCQVKLVVETESKPQVFSSLLLGFSTQ
jgi:hypothetical protein